VSAYISQALGRRSAEEEMAEIMPELPSHVASDT
jgi:hypothetical protein